MHQGTRGSNQSATPHSAIMGFLQVYDSFQRYSVHKMHPTWARRGVLFIRLVGFVLVDAIQFAVVGGFWIPAFAGMTIVFGMTVGFCLCEAGIGFTRGASAKTCQLSYPNTGASHRSTVSIPMPLRSAYSST